MTAHRDALLLGIDLGTSSVKVVVATTAGEALRTASAEYPVLRPQVTYAEQEPEAWREGVIHAVREAIAGVDAAVIAAIGLSGQMHGVVPLDGSGSVLGRAIIWPDQRSREQVTALTTSVGLARLVQMTGSPIATGFMAATLLWLREHEPDLWSRLGVALLPKDWLRLWLTGEVATDASDGSGALLLDVRTRDWCDELLERVGLRREQLPQVKPSSALAGGLTESAARELGLRAGTPVVVGAADAACSLLGAGAVEPGTLVVNLSTGGQVVLPVATPEVDVRGRIHTFCSALAGGESGPGWYQMGACLSVGMALAWLRSEVFGWSGDVYARMSTMAAEVAPGADGLLFLPYLVGERTPHMDPQARAMFLGLTAAHGQAHLVRAVMEGATFATYDAFQVLAGLGGRPQEVVLAGGGSRSPIWQQMVADLYGVPVRRLLVSEQSAMGAAILAAAAVGFLDAATAARQWTRLGDPVNPDTAAGERYARQYELFRAAYQANRDLMHALQHDARGKVEAG